MFNPFTVTFSLEHLEDLRVVHGLDAVECLAETLSLEIVAEIDRQTIQMINLLESEPTEEVTMVGNNRLWISEEELTDIRTWSGTCVLVEPEEEKVNWKKEGF